MKNLINQLSGYAIIFALLNRQNTAFSFEKLKKHASGDPKIRIDPKSKIDTTAFRILSLSLSPIISSHKH